jgi:hypothetical protein
MGETNMKTHLRKYALTALILGCALLLGACASDNKRTQSLDFTLQQYEQVIRWSQWDGAVDFLAPGYLEKEPITRLDMDRLRLFRVTGYTIRSTMPFDEGTAVRQVVEIRLFNKNRAVERALIDQQEWRYHAERERWYLHSGLPDVTQAR